MFLAVVATAVDEFGICDIGYMAFGLGNITVEFLVCQRKKLPAKDAKTFLEELEMLAYPTSPHQTNT